MRFQQIEKVSIVSSSFVIITLLLAVTAFVWILILALRVAKEMKEYKIQQFVSKYPNLYEDLKQTKISRLIVLWKPLILLRQLLTYTILITMKRYAASQIILLLIMSFLHQCCILNARPYEKWGANFIAFINEFAVSMSLYLMFLLTDNTETQINPESDPKMEYQVSKYRVCIAWALVILLLSTILINFIFSSSHLLKDLIRSVRNHLERRKLRQLRYEENNNNTNIVQELTTNNSNIDYENRSFENQNWIKIKNKKTVFKKLS